MLFAKWGTIYRLERTSRQVASDVDKARNVRKTIRTKNTREKR